MNSLLLHMCHQPQASWDKIDRQGKLHVWDKVFNKIAQLKRYKFLYQPEIDIKPPIFLTVNGIEPLQLIGKMLKKFSSWSFPENVYLYVCSFSHWQISFLLKINGTVYVLKIEGFWVGIVLTCKCDLPVDRNRKRGWMHSIQSDTPPPDLNLWGQRSPKVTAAF